MISDGRCHLQVILRLSLSIATAGNVETWKLYLKVVVKFIISR